MIPTPIALGVSNAPNIKRMASQVGPGDWLRGSSQTEMLGTQHKHRRNR
jgi:hypothetical protein